ncbi:hypothetical protein THZG08_210008 [Vibrio owensii]|nr:hypothetical protein THZG08_210008 [Vibrio owensii]CAH1559730.1 hypothetical protein THOA03_210008 [Vibrio owensii]CAH1568813.1 hypothetical protein THZB04_20439 [Vibrio owensii]
MYSLVSSYRKKICRLKLVHFLYDVSTPINSVSLIVFSLYKTIPFSIIYVINAPKTHLTIQSPHFYL